MKLLAAADTRNATATAGAKLDQLIVLARGTLIATTVGATVLVIAIGYAGIEYFRFKAAMATAAMEMTKGRDTFAARIKAVK